MEIIGQGMVKTANRYQLARITLLLNTMEPMVKKII